MMSDRNEELSTLLDDYRDTEQDRSVLDELQADVNQLYTARRYQMIGSVMRNEISHKVDLDFEARVRSLIEQQAPLSVAPSVNAVKPPKASRLSAMLSSIFLKPVAGLAVAATVAIVTVSSFQVQNSSEEQSTSVASSEASRAKVEQLANLPVVQNAVRVSGNAQVVTTPAGTSWKIKRSKPDMQSKLNNYLVNHNEYSNSMHGIIPQARVVGFDGSK
jgi:sigma-E factor negative regulatory protein RseA